MTPKRAQVVVIGNTKGGSGKSTIAMHVIVGLLLAGKSVASVDMDVDQSTLTRYVENRRASAGRDSAPLPLSDHHVPAVSRLENRNEAQAEEQEKFMLLMGRLMTASDVVVIDTPGTDTFLNRIGHAFADTLITPMNDSFVDLDVLAKVDGQALKIIGPSRYAEMVWQQKIKKAAARGGPVDWVLMRNRLSNLDARNKRAMADALEELSRRFGFRMVPGFGERVIYRELFPLGLTLLDLPRAGEEFQMAHVAARQEIRNLLGALHIG